MISKRSKKRAAIALAWLLLLLPLLPVLEDMRRSHFMVGAWRLSTDRQKLVLNPDGHFKLYDAYDTLTYEGDYKLQGSSYQGSSYLVLQSRFLHDGNRKREYGTPSMMEGLPSGLDVSKLYTPVWGRRVYYNNVMHSGTPLTEKETRVVYWMERV